MQFLVIFTNKTEFLRSGMPDDFSERFAEDAAHIRWLYSQGVVRTVWTVDTAEKGGVALLEAASSEQLGEILADIPLVRVGYNDYQVLPLRPFPGFGELPR